MQLRTYLDRRRLSAREFAKQAGLSHVTIYEILAGRANISLATVRKIHDATEGRVWLAARPKNGRAA